MQLDLIRKFQSFSGFIKNAREPAPKGNEVSVENADQTQNSSSASGKITRNALLQSMPSSRSVTSKKPTNVSELLEGTYGSEIPISDDDEDESSPALGPTKLKASVHRSEKVRRHAVKQLEDRSNSLEEEDWLLGVARQSPPDATIIMPPRTFTRSKPAGFRPLDTLHGPASSSRSQYLHQKTRRVSSSPGSPAATRTVIGSRRNGAGHAAKRRRIETSPDVSHKHNTIDVDGVQYKQERDDLGLRESITPTAVHLRKDLDQSRYFDYTRLRESDKNHDRVQEIRRVQDESEDDLFPQTFTGRLGNERQSKQDRTQRQMQRLEQGREDANRIQQRLDGTPTISKAHLDGILQSSSPAQNHKAYHQHQERGSTELSPSDRTTSTAKASKRAVMLKESSPDQLQSEETTRSAGQRRNPVQHSQSKLHSPRTSLSRSAERSRLSQRTLLELPVSYFTGCSALPKDASYVLVLDIVEKHIYIDHELHALSSDPIMPKIPLSKIHRVMHATDDNTTITLIDYARGAFSGAGKLCVEFKSEKAQRDFLMKIQIDSNINLVQRSSEWLLKVPHNAEKGIRKQSYPFIPESDLTTVKDEPHDKTKTHDDISKSLRIRRIDRLDNPPQGNRQLSMDSDARRSSARTESNETGVAASIAGEEALQGMPRRATRLHSNQDKSQEKRRSKTPVGDEWKLARKSPWKTDLVYPSTGKKKESVSWHDVDRLEDEQFLNDNLVGLFLRYLQEQTEKTDEKMMKKLHFFSSFFFNKLTSASENKRNRRQINYDGVKNWTKMFNIFTRDFVIVPVNENLHWYVMIICNLPQLKKRAAANQNDGTSELESADEEANMVFTDAIQVPIADVDANDVETRHENQSSTRTTRAKGSTRRIHRQRKYDLRNPIIITLDSLNLGRSGTASVLKSYIAEEAKERLNLEIDAAEIQGMTAKGIPVQSNWSDCGLYVCMYLEQFMRDPYQFVRNVLQRETSGPHWPSKIESRSLRQRFYNTLQDLHENAGSDLPPIGSILVDMDTTKPNNSHSHRPLTPETIEKGAEYFDQYRASKIQEDESQDRYEGEPIIQTAQQILDYDRQAHVVSDDESEVVEILAQDNSHIRSKYFRSTDRANNKHLANMQSIQNVQDSPMVSQRPRHASVTTDFLSGDKSYEILHEEEVPETQSELEEILVDHQGGNIEEMLID